MKVNRDLLLKVLGSSFNHNNSLKEACLYLQRFNLIDADDYNAINNIIKEEGSFKKVLEYLKINKDIIEFLKQKARPFLFSTGLDSAMCGAGIKVVELMSNSDEKVKKLWENAEYLQSQLKERGFNTWKTQSPISPVIVGEEAMATEMTKNLFEKNILVSAIMYPTVAKGLARIRLMPSAAHSKEDLDEAIEAITAAGKELKII